MKVGDTVKRKLRIYDPDLGPRKAEQTVTATVVYVHPAHRFVTLRYDLPGGSYLETARLIPKT